MTNDKTALRITGVDKDGNPIYGAETPDPGFKAVIETLRADIATLAAARAKSNRGGK